MIIINRIIMIVTLVYVNVKREFLDQFIHETELNQAESAMESGNLRFDILQDESDPSLFAFYEAYISEDAIAEHKKTPHYNRWRERVADWMEEPRKGVRYNVLFPNDPSKW